MACHIYLFSCIFAAFEVPCADKKMCTREEMIHDQTLEECGFGVPGA